MESWRPNKDIIAKEDQLFGHLKLEIPTSYDTMNFWHFDRLLVVFCLVHPSTGKLPTSPSQHSLTVYPETSHHPALAWLNPLAEYPLSHPALSVLVNNCPSLFLEI